MSKDLVKVDDQGVVDADIIDVTDQYGVVLKIEHDRMTQTAQARPRDMALVRRSLEQSLAAFPESADGAFYVLPRGGDKIEGPSVKAARELVRAWGNLTVTANIIAADDDHAVVQGVATDFQTSTRLEAPPIRVSRMSKRKGQMVRLNADDWNNKIAIASSKAWRNAALLIIPSGMIEAYVELCKNIIKDRKKPPGRPNKAKVREQILKGFDSWPALTAEVLATLVGVADIADCTEDQKVSLRGLVTALREGTTTVEACLEQVSGVVEQGVSPEGDTATLQE